MKKRVLIISPIPIFPLTAGNRSRIFFTCEILRKHDFEIDFLHLIKEDSDEKKMTSYFGPDNYYPFQERMDLKRALIEYKNIILFKFLSFFRFLSRSPIANIFFNNRVDDYYSKKIDLYIKKHFTNSRYDFVLAEYVVFSKALLNFSSTKKIIDTHDILTDRFKIYLQKNIRPEFYSLFRRQEAKGLKRTDTVIAIQDEERHFFSSISNKRVEVIGHLIAPVKSKDPCNDTLLFVGSDNIINVQGLEHFINYLFPLIQKEHPGVKLQVSGSIIKASGKFKMAPNIFFTGKYDDSQKLYDGVQIVIVPITFGTGLKIKTIEALAHSKPVVTFKEGISGLEEPNNSSPYCAISKDNNEFINNTITLLKDKSKRDIFSKNAFDFISAYYDSNEKALINSVFCSAE